MSLVEKVIKENMIPALFHGFQYQKSFKSYETYFVNLEEWVYEVLPKMLTTTNTTTQEKWQVN